jgi:hypothetical protein
MGMSCRSVFPKSKNPRGGLVSERNPTRCDVKDNLQVVGQTDLAFAPLVPRQGMLFACLHAYILVQSKPKTALIAGVLSGGY